jgi:hypothetical protein
LVPAVNEVDKDSGTLGRELIGKGGGDKMVVLAVGGVDEEVEATADGETKLALGEEKFSKGVSVELSEDAAGETAPGSTDTNGAEFIKVSCVFV